MKTNKKNKKCGRARASSDEPSDSEEQSKNKTITIQKINDAKVKVIKIKDPLSKPSKCEDMFPNPYGNVVIVARKCSGKSNLIANIIKNAAEPGETSVICMSTTVNKDPIWETMRKWCKKKNISFTGVTELNSFDGSHKKRNFLTDFMKEVLKGGEEQELGSEEEEPEGYSDEDSEEEYYDSREDIEADTQYDLRSFKVGHSKPKGGLKFTKDKSSLKKEVPYIYPDYITIFDDIGEEIGSRPVQAFVKKNRHLHCLNILSVQNIKDACPSMHKQTDYYILFGGLPYDAIEKVKKEGSLGVPIESLWEMYKSSTKAKFSFLWIDVRNEQYRRNFNELFHVAVK